jgi:outer membrane protein OmpA-like peptidoglycan-associated protein
LVSKLIDLQKPLVLDRIEFENKKWDILPEMHKSLDLVLKYLLDNPTYKLHIAGHTDSQGSAVDNLTLSKNRAESIRSYIIEKGKIDPDRITAEGFGNTKPLRPEEKNADDRRINRRVEFDILKP